MEDQGAVVVGRVPDKVKGRHGLKRSDSFIPDRAPLDLSKHFKVIDHKPSIVDGDLNERIQKEGAHCWGPGSEAQWYAEHKGYSERL